MIFFSEKCLEYRSPGHPESPERVQRTYEYLKKKNYQFQQARACKEESILLAHTPQHVEKVKDNDFFDPDCPNYENIYQYALLSAGGAVQTVEKTLEGNSSFSLLRPPGHHAGKDYLGGFCYFNNIAIAVKWALKKVDKVAIIDFDGHHGNGTENIFLGKKSTLYLSLHQHPAYPGTGEKSRANIINVPLSPGWGEEEFMRFFNQALEKVKEFSPSLIAVSAGFDAHRKDPLLALNLEIETYHRIGEKIRNLEKPIFALLEGGYHQDLPVCVENFLRGAGIE